MGKIEFKKLSSAAAFGAALLLLLLLSSVPGKAQNVVEFVKVDSLSVGDTFSYTLTLSKDRSYDGVQYPDSADFGADFEIRSRQHYRVTDFRDSLVYSLQFFGTEDTRISSLPIELIAGSDTTVVRTTPVPVYFKSVLQAESQEFRPLKPIFDFARTWWPYILALIILGFAGWYLYRWYRQKAAEPKPQPKPEFQPEPFANPLSQLERSLKELRSFSFSDEEDFKQFYINLGDAIRTYFEDLYKIPALESTSREIIYDLERRMVDERLIQQTRKVLREADMVKFAKFQPTEEQAQVSLSIAENFLKVAREIDEPRVEHLRRRHQSEMEKRRRAYHKEEEEETETKEVQDT